ncbi:hypothetical protein CRG98_031039 [Punica granatum]|uniref:Uncharacterized protein n=1 Tax=Punica granatum TaxID=22663 RepID=A0A2I0IX34_PUNGR|nr:hypothetical protein CRG98_031039 [Punica granatum]
MGVGKWRLSKPVTLRSGRHRSLSRPHLPPHPPTQVARPPATWVECGVVGEASPPPSQIYDSRALPAQIRVGAALVGDSNPRLRSSTELWPAGGMGRGWGRQFGQILSSQDRSSPAQAVEAVVVVLQVIGIVVVVGVALDQEWSRK